MGNSHMTGDAWRPDLYSNLTSWGHAWDTRTKVIALVIFVFGVVSLQSIYALLIAFALVVLAVVSVKIPLSFFIKRVKWVLPFLIFIFVGLILGRGLNHLHDSLYFGGAVSLKALTSITATFLVLGTQSLENFFKGLSQIKLPKVIVSILFLTYRYVYLFRDVFQDTYRALVSRGFCNTFSKQTMKVYGEMTGTLFIKALDRSEIVLKSMEARGFDGSMPLQSPSDRKLNARDMMKTLGVILVTGSLLWLDWGVI